MGIDKIAVFIIDLNRSIETEQAVRSVLQSRSVNLTVMLHINGSGEEHARRLINAFTGNPQVLISRTEKNAGFTGAVNLLMMKNKEAGIHAQYILLLNNDASVGPETVATLLSILIRQPGIGAVGPRILQDNNPDLIAADGARTWFWIMQQRFRNSGAVKCDCPALPAYEVPFVPGTCLLIRTDIFTRLGGFDQGFFAYFEDWDLGLRMREIGYRCLHVSEAEVRHAGSITTGKDSLVYHFLMTRNRYLMARKHLPLPVFIFIFLPYFLLSRVLYKMITLLARRRWEGARGILMGLGWLMAPVAIRTRFWPIPIS